MIDSVKKIGLFYSYPKRQRHLEQSLQEVNTIRREAEVAPVPEKKMKKMCETRWVERHTVLEDLHDMYEVVVDSLQKIANAPRRLWDSKSSTEAQGLFTAVTKPGFLVALACNMYVFGYTKSLSMLLQGESQDIITGYEEVRLVCDELKSVREESEQEFRQVFMNAKDL